MHDEHAHDDLRSISAHSPRRPGSFIAFLSMFYGNTGLDTWPASHYRLPRTSTQVVIRELISKFKAEHLVDCKRANKGFIFIPMTYPERVENNGNQYFKLKVSTPRTRG
jgi:hypothetical protein